MYQYKNIQYMGIDENLKGCGIVNKIMTRDKLPIWDKLQMGCRGEDDRIDSTGDHIIIQRYWEKWSLFLEDRRGLFYNYLIIE